MNDFKADYERLYKENYQMLKCIKRLIISRNLRYMFWLRLFGNNEKFFWGRRAILQYYANKYGLEIPTSVGAGLVLAHPYAITINGKVKIGKNCTIFKGVTVGSIRSGSKVGVPKIEDNVTLCSNCMVCGDIHIGSNVLIAGNAFVNFDVPSDSIVLGNPGVIHPKVDASDDYL